MYYLRRAISLLQAAGGHGYELDDDRRYGRLVHEIEGSIESWLSSAMGLLDTANWRLDRLNGGNGSLRKPRAWLDTFVTSKGNLALEWRPERPNQFEDSDFRHFADHWPIGGADLPFNRVVMIREFDRLDLRFSDRKYTEVDRLLLEAIKDHLSYVEGALSRLCDVVVHRKLYLEYEERSSRPSERELVGWAIREVEDVERNLREARRSAWLRERFDDRFGITPRQFLEAFRDAEGVFARTCKILRERVRMKALMDGSQAKNLAVRLYREHEELYDSVCTFPPRGEKERASAKVIPLRERD